MHARVKVVVRTCPEEAEMEHEPSMGAEGTTTVVDAITRERLRLFVSKDNVNTCVDPGSRVE